MVWDDDTNSCVGSGKKRLYKNYSRYQSTLAYCSEDGADAVETQ